MLMRSKSPLVVDAVFLFHRVAGVGFVVPACDLREIDSIKPVVVIIGGEHTPAALVLGEYT